MSGRHRRPEPDALPDVDVADRLTAGPVVEAPSAVESQHGRHAGRSAGPVPDVPSSPSRPPGTPPPPAATAPVVPTVPGARPGSAPAAPGRTVVARRDRAAARAARREAARKRNLRIAAVAGVVLVVLGALGWLLFGRGGDDPPVETTSGPPQQETLLMQVTGPDGTAAASALAGVTPSDGTGAVVLVPSRLLVDVAGTGDIPFGETVTLSEPSAPSQALTDLLGVRVDDSWVLNQAAFAAVVDAVGGVQAAVDVDVVRTEDDGSQTVVVRAGNQKLGGASAAAYATYLGEGEPEQARLARFDDVLGGLLEALPADRADVVTVVGKAGDGSQTTLDASGLAARLVDMKNAAADQELVSDVLPVTEIDTGSGTASYGIEPGQVAAMMRSRFPGALQQDAGGEVLRVLVENGVGTPGLVEKARTKLVDDGFRFINGGNAASFDNEESAVIIPDGTEKSVSRGERVARSLGLPTTSVVPSDRGQTVADVIVILGKDFAP
jgi:anionic cell wall polymer biosynthesis LytR-Cps2A-Psr (LCP) family protein